ncbi:MAG: hypothetical protein NVS3B12_26810 [Acidimicrobiales bacterium]
MEALSHSADARPTIGWPLTIAWSLATGWPLTVGLPLTTEWPLAVAEPKCAPGEVACGPS